MKNLLKYPAAKRLRRLSVTNSEHTASSSFLFFADLMGSRVFDADGIPVGRLHDIAFQISDIYPKAVSLTVTTGILHPRRAEIPWSHVRKLFPLIQLDVPTSRIQPVPSHNSHELRLRRDILDKQVVDTNNHKVIRVNDIHLLQVETDLRIAHVDVGIRGLVRRLGWQPAVDFFVAGMLPRTTYFKDHFISWKYIQLLATNPKSGTLKLTVPEWQLARIPKSDFREVMMDMDVYQRTALFRSLTPDMRVQVFKDLDPETQKRLLESLEVHEAAYVLGHTPADQATDVLERLPKSASENLLGLMETSHARRLSALLGYTSDSAGGIMTTEMVALPSAAKVQDAVQAFKQFSPSMEGITSFVFLTENENRLTGMVPTRRLVVAHPEDSLAQYALLKTIYVRVNDNLRVVAFQMEFHKLSAIPVVNNGKEKILQGIITVDDILKHLIPIAWKRRARKPSP